MHKVSNAGVGGWGRQTALQCGKGYMVGAMASVGGVAGLPNNRHAFTAQCRNRSRLSLYLCACIYIIMYTILSLTLAYEYNTYNFLCLFIQIQKCTYARTPAFPPPPTQKLLLGVPRATACVALCTKAPLGHVRRCVGIMSFVL